MSARPKPIRLMRSGDSDNAGNGGTEEAKKKGGQTNYEGDAHESYKSRR